MTTGQDPEWDNDNEMSLICYIFMALLTSAVLFAAGLCRWSLRLFRFEEEDLEA